LKSIRLLFATRNQWKAQLFAPVFAGYGFDVVTLNDVAIRSPLPQENSVSALENALVKARHFRSEVYPWIFADDAGLEIDALGGQPGVQARRWNGIFSDDVDDQTWLDYLLERMKDVPLGERTAAFVAGWVLLDPTGNAYTRQVRAPFEIAIHPIRPISPGSPITAVRLGPVDDLTRRQAEVRAEWDQWQIFEKLLSVG
jgi:inosine/xanthosine triphosphate pyrophosphatase family protein